MCENMSSKINDVLWHIKSSLSGYKCQQSTATAIKEL